MQIVLKSLVPDYISDVKNSEIWNHEITISGGEHVHIVAPSGSGKSSLIHFIYGLRNDYAGSIIVEGMEMSRLTGEKKSELRQKHLSVVFQDLRLFPDETAMENIEIKRRLNPYHSGEKVIQMANRLGIENKLEQKVKTCSYGEQQRIAIIRALVQPFDFILLDEPYSHLDENNRSKAMELLYEECNKRNAAMIFADLKSLELLKNEKTYYL